MNQRNMIFILFFILASLYIGQSQAQICPEGCNNCTNVTCTVCFAKYYKVDKQCLPCPKNCVSCDKAADSSKPVCTGCENNSTNKLNADASGCYACSKVCTTCEASPDNCTACPTGTDLTTVGTFNGKVLKKCQRPANCSSPCKTCNATGCASCIDGLYLDGSTCKPCKFPCKICSSDTVCTTPLPGFIVDGGNVTKCGRGCIQCNASACITCKEGSIPAGADCNRCQPPCSTCSTNGTTCTSCRPPYILKGSECILCNSQCSDCQKATPNVCIKCARTFSFSPKVSDGSCYKCDDFNCRTCTEANKTLCIQCNGGFILNPNNGKCDKCPQFCKLCAPNTVNASKLECVECYERSVVTNDLKCMRCAQGCLLCSIISGTTTTCTKCADGGWNNQGNCMRCKQGCQTCDNGKQCTSFADGFIEIQGTMYRLRPGCKIGDLMNPEKCAQCADNYFISSGNCKRCSKDCVSCTDLATCTICGFGTVLDNGTCTRCGDKCLTCQSAANKDVCKSCPLGTVLDNNTCAAKCADKNCLECDVTNKTICSKFKDGYSVNQNNKMIRCLSSCGGKCNSKKPSQCLSPAYGYELIDGKSSKCPEGAITCQNAKPSQCEDRYELKEVNGTFKCVQRCRVPCSECTEDDVCTACMLHFIFDNATKRCNPDLTCNGTNNCVVCPFGSYRVGGGNTSCVACTVTNCASCSNSQCFECRQGFWFNPADTTCTACTADCQRCRDATTCDVCMRGYIRQIQVDDNDRTISKMTFSKSCSKCTEPCKTCFGKVTTCKSCIDGFRINGTLCVSNTTVAVVATITGNSDTFITDGKQSDHCTNLANHTGVAENSTIPNNVAGGTKTRRRLLQTDITTISTSISLNSNDNAATISTAALSSLVTQYGTSLVSSSVTIQAQDGSTISESSKNNVGLIVGVVIGGFVFLVLVGILVYFVCIRAKTQVVGASHQQLGNVQNESMEIDKNKGIKH